MKIEWDPKKARLNLRKHRVSFEEDATAMSDPMAAAGADSDHFPGSFVRGKYARRLRKSSNIVVLRPEVAEAFPNEEAVNKTLLSLIDVAQKTTRLARRSTGVAGYMLKEHKRFTHVWTRPRS